MPVYAAGLAFYLFIRLPFPQNMSCSLQNSDQTRLANTSLVFDVFSVAERCF